MRIWGGTVWLVVAIKTIRCVVSEGPFFSRKEWPLRLPTPPGHSLPLISLRSPSGSNQEKLSDGVVTGLYVKLG